MGAYLSRLLEFRSRSSLEWDASSGVGEVPGPCGKEGGCPVGGHCAGEYGTVLSGPLNVDCNGKAGVVELNTAR